MKSESGGSKFIFLFGGLFTSLILVAVTYFSLPDSNLHLYFLDVGQGDSILVKTASNYKILVDGGPNNRVLESVGKRLPFWDKKIDLMVVTNPDSDHIKGLAAVLSRYQVGQVWLSNIPKDTQALKDLKEMITTKQVSYYAPITGDQLSFPDGTVIRVLWPKERSPKFNTVNESSIVLSINYGKFSSLLTGDAIQTTQPYPNFDVGVDVLKVPHHGAKNGLNTGYLQTLKPELAVISAGKNNRFGHPDEVTIDKLKKVSANIVSTINEGTIEVVSTGETWYTRTER